MARLTPANYKPILQYHFIVEFSKFGMDLGQNATNYAFGSDLPSVVNNSQVLEYGNVYTYYKGKTKWNPLSMQLYSLAQPNTNQKLWDYLNQHQDVASGAEKFKDDYVADVTIKLLNPDETPIGQWKLINAFADEISWGTVTWQGQDVVSIDVTFVFDHAEWS